MAKTTKIAREQLVNTIDKRLSTTTKTNSVLEMLIDFDKDKSFKVNDVKIYCGFESQEHTQKLEKLNLPTNQDYLSLIKNTMDAVVDLGYLQKDKSGYKIANKVKLY